MLIVNVTLLLSLVIITTTQDLLPCRLENESMLILCRERSLDIHQRRILFDDTNFHQVTKSQHILLLSDAVQVASAEGKCAELLVDSVE
jgi:hypothetical protein